MRLSEFLLKAKLACYAGGKGADEMILEDGAKELAFESCGFRYRDRYYGFNPFVGQEVVWEHGTAVWSMNYFGKISSDAVPAKEVYRFLRRAMRGVKEDRPFRGPDRFSAGDLEYIDRSSGDLRDFTGTEVILHEGKEIYRLVYHGGAVRDR